MNRKITVAPMLVLALAACGERPEEAPPAGSDTTAVANALAAAPQGREECLRGPLQVAGFAIGDTAPEALRRFGRAERRLAGHDEDDGGTYATATSIRGGREIMIAREVIYRARSTEAGDTTSLGIHPGQPRAEVQRRLSNAGIPLAAGDSVDVPGCTPLQSLTLVFAPTGALRSISVETYGP
jgi:hypothetical protein